MSTYKPSEHDGLKQDGTPDKRVNPEHGFGGDHERASELGKLGGKVSGSGGLGGGDQEDSAAGDTYKPSDDEGIEEDDTLVKGTA